MGIREILFWPIYRLADWINDNPVSAVGALVAIATLAVLVISIVLGEESATLAFDSAMAILFVDRAIERPAYPVAALVGIAVVLFYDG